MDTLKQYALAAVGGQGDGGVILLGPGAQIYGSVAASKTLGLGDGVAIDGNACSQYINSANKELSNITGEYGSCSGSHTMRQEIEQLSASLAIQETPELKDIQGNHKLSAGLYHVNDLILGPHDALILRGEEGQRVVVNVHGNAQMDAGSKVMLTGGLKSEDVYFNFLNKDKYGSFEFGGATLVGTYVSNGRTFIMGDGATLQDARFYTTGNIIADVDFIRFDESPPIPYIQPIPDVLDAQSVIDVTAPWTSIFFVLFCVAARFSKRKNV